MLAQAMVVIILIYIYASNQLIVHLKLTQCYVNYISKKAGKYRRKKIKLKKNKLNLFFMYIFFNGTMLSGYLEERVPNESQRDSTDVSVSALGLAS